jgi:hypothetical protein
VRRAGIWNKIQPEGAHHWIPVQGSEIIFGTYCHGKVSSES